MTPSIAIIIPCYNSAPYIAETIASVLAQSSPADEVLVIDDGSTDDSAAIIGQYAGSITLLSQSNAGVSAARNHGLRHATSEHVLFLDADDTLAPDALERLRAAVCHSPQSVMLMGWYEFGDHVKGRTGPHVYRINNFFPEIIKANFGPNHTRLVPRQAALLAGGFPEGMRIYEDWHFWTRVALLGTPLVALDYVGANYRRHDSSCLADPRERDVAAGYLAVATLQCERIAHERPDLLTAHGEMLFWSGWTAFERARKARIPVAEMTPLAAALERMIASGPRTLNRSVFAKAVRLLGFPKANRLRAILGS